MKVLHVAAEHHPQVKTGGLADVLGALPAAQMACGAEPRLLLPGFEPLLDALTGVRKVTDMAPMFGAARIQLLLGRLPHHDVPCYVIDAPLLYRRPGTPYQSPDGNAWPDNARRFALLGWVAAHLASGELDAAWRPSTLHAHDWHAGLALAYLATQPARVASHPGFGRAASVLTVHNLAYQGLFDPLECADFGLPMHHFTPDGFEFHGQLSFLKAGLVFADHLTTVSPTYAQEITTPAFGHGLDGLLTHRRDDLSGILNGIDRKVWDPSSDLALAQRYGMDDVEGGKAANKLALRQAHGLDHSPAAAHKPLIGIVSRLAEQKGLDWVIESLPAIVAQGAQIMVLGSGDAKLERDLQAAVATFPGQVATFKGFNEPLSHQIFAASDMTLVPSRFEPCGLTQLYGLRYGAVPIVRGVGGLADTVVDTSAGARGTGFVFPAASDGAPAMMQAISRAIQMHQDRPRWVALQRHGMAQNFSWDVSAQAYLQLYRKLNA
jgi:starch synthase